VTKVTKEMKKMKKSGIAKEKATLSMRGPRMGKGLWCFY